MEELILNQSVGAAGYDYGPLGSDFAGTIFENWLYPGMQQQREFGQQVALTREQNQWNSEGERLKRMVDAGINPYLAAQGIANAGGVSSAAASPNSAIGSGAEGVNAASSLLGNSTSAAVGALDSVEKLATLNERRAKLRAETVASLEAAGLSSWEAKAIAEMLPDRKSNLRADTYLKLGQYRNTVAEYRNIRKEYDVKKQTIDTMKKQASMYESQGNLAEAMRLKVNAEAEGIKLDNWWKETDKQFWLDHGYRMDDEMDVALRNAAANGHNFDVDQVGQTIENFHYSEEKGVRDADIDTAFNLAFNEILGNEAASAEYLPYKSKIQNDLNALKAYYDALGSGRGDPVTFLVQKVMVPILKENAEHPFVTFDSSGIRPISKKSSHAQNR